MYRPNALNKDIYVYDVNSLYPFVMSKFKYPIKQISQFEGDPTILENSVDKVHEAIKSIPSLNSNSNNKLIFDFNLDSFYSYLDSLTLAQELALIHILFAILYLLIAFEFFSIFFGNEIINYFDLENKYPKLKTFFKLRATYQRYYLIWCLLKLFLLCFILIIFNLFIYFFIIFNCVIFIFKI